MPDGRLISGDIRELELPVGGELTVDLHDGDVEDGVGAVDATDVNLKEVKNSLAAELGLPDLKARDLTRVKKK